MVIRIGSNIDSLRAQRSLSRSDTQLQGVYERLASGQRINRASDDAAGLAISERLRTNSRVLGQAVRNVNDAISVLNVADGALSSLNDILSRQTELATQAASGTFSDKQRTALNKENTELAAEYRRIVESTSFNGLRIFEEQNARINVQIGNDVLAVNTAETQAGSSSIQGTGVYDESTVFLGYSRATAKGDYLAKDLNSDGISDLVALQLEDRGDGETRIWVHTFLGRASGTGFTERSSYAETVSNGEYPGGGNWVSLLARFGVGNTVLVEANDGGVTFNGSFSIDGSGTVTGPGSESFTGSNESSRENIFADFNGDGVNDEAEDNTANSIRFAIQRTTSSTTPARSLITASVSTNTATSVATRSSALSALDTFAQLRTLVSNNRATVGTSLARVEVASRVTSATQLQYDAAGDRIRSADIAKEAADLLRLGIARSAAQSVLAQANQQPALALTLLRT